MSGNFPYQYVGATFLSLTATLITVEEFASFEKYKPMIPKQTEWSDMTQSASFVDSVINFNASYLSTLHTPPQKVIGDYIKIAYLSLLFVVGAPINVAAYFQMADAPIPSQGHIGTTAIMLLRRHLNYADLIIMCGYIPSEVCWLLAYQWKGGDVLCRTIMFLRMLAFQISSNIVVCIALNRCLLLAMPTRHETNRARFMTVVAWLLAIVISLPQFAVWKTVQPFSKLKWHQCATTWEIETETALRENATATTMLIDQGTYNLIHLLLVYYIPLLIIIASYTVLLFSLRRHAREMIELASLTPSRVTSVKNKRGPADDMYKSRSSPTIVVVKPDEDATEQLLQDVHRKEPHSAHVRLDGRKAAPNTHTGEEIQAERQQKTRPNQRTTQNGLAANEENDRQQNQPTRKEKNEAEQHPTTEQNAMRTKKQLKKQASQTLAGAQSRTVNISLILVGTYVVCWAPFNVLQAWKIADWPYYRDHLQNLDNLQGLMLFNSMINPFLYGMFGPLNRCFSNEY